MAGYTTGTGNRLSSDGTYNYSYDNVGNLIVQTTIATGERIEYSWDHRNRLVEVLYKTSGGTVTKNVDFVYDPFDRLIKRSVDPDGAGPQPTSVTWTAYDGVHPYADFNGSGTLTNRYLYGPAIDMILARVDPSGNITWHLTDHLGSVRDYANSFGQVTDHVKYGSYGNIISETQPTNGDRFKYTAREWESAVDLYFSRARWLDDDTGRFISEDPISFEAGDTNINRYVRNSPTTHTDPSGHDVIIPPKTCAGRLPIFQQDFDELVPGRYLVDLKTGKVTIKQGSQVEQFKRTAEILDRVIEANEVKVTIVVDPRSRTLGKPVFNEQRKLESTVINMPPVRPVFIIEKRRVNGVPACMLFHELSHVYINTHDGRPKDQSDIMAREQRTQEMEREMQEEHKWPRRPPDSKHDVEVVPR